MSRVLVTASTSGLANRVHCFISAIRLAPILGRSLELYWPPTEQLNCEFHSLFKPGWPVLPLTQLTHSLLRCEWSVKSYFTDRCLEIARKDPEAIVFPKTWCNLRLKDDDHAKAYKEELAVLKTLEPVEPVMEKAARLLEPFTSKKIPVVGVHIRTCDIVGVHYGSGKVYRQHEIYARSATDFICQIQHAVDAGWGVFVAADDPLMEEAVVGAFPRGRVIRQVKGTEWRKNTEGMLEALVDLYALSMTRAVVGTRHSQFSQLAAELSGLKLFLASNTGEFDIKALG